MPMDSVLGRKNGKKDCYYEWTIGFHQVKVGNCFMEIKGLDDVFQEYFNKGKTPDEIAGIEMINDIRKQNFIPRMLKTYMMRPYQKSTKFTLTLGRETIHKSSYPEKHQAETIAECGCTGGLLYRASERFLPQRLS